jgi:hypothetical protein
MRRSRFVAALAITADVWLSRGAVAAQAGGPAGTPTPTPTPAAAPTSPTSPTFATAAAKTPSPSARTFCAEWIRQSREGYERITLFADGMLVWKRSRDGKDDVQRKRIAPDELTFYCDYFSRDEVFATPGDQRTGLSGDFTAASSLTLCRLDGSKKMIRFDDFSSLSAEAAGMRAALEGLRTMLTSPLAPASRFAPETLAVGQILKRFDGVFFRIKSIEKEKGIVELEGVREPYREYRKMEDLRFQFSPPE